MMNCAEVREEFSALLDGELGAQARAAVQEHLAGCADCLRELDKLKQVDAAFRGLAPKQAPEDLEERVRAGLQANVVQFRPRRLVHKRVWPLVASAAGLLLVLGVSVVELRKGPERFDMAALDRGPEQEVLANDMGNVLSQPQGTTDAAPEEKGMAAEKSAFGGVPMARKSALPSLEAMAVDQGDESQAPRREVNLPAPTEEVPYGAREPGEPSMEPEVDDVRPIARADAQEQLSALGYLADGGADESGESTVGKSLDSLHDAEERPATSGFVVKSKPGERSLSFGAPFTAKELTPADVIAAPSVLGEDAPEEDGGMGISEVSEEHISHVIAADLLPSPPLILKEGVPRPAAARVAGAEPPALSPTPEPTPKTPMRARAKPTPAVREAAGRTFEWRDGTWYQEGYRAESDAADLVTLERGSAQFEELAKEYARFAEFAAVGDRVVFRFQRKWWSVGAA